MKKWLRRSLIAFSLIAITFGVCYEIETHVARGWLRGEAFFDGRPTSYWSLRCDEWLDRFDDQDSLTQVTWMLPFELPDDPRLRGFGIPDDLEFKGFSMANPPETFWKRLRDSVRSKTELEREAMYRYSPKILRATPETEPVLKVLQSEEKYQYLATLALRRVEHYRKHEAEFAKERQEIAP